MSVVKSKRTKSRFEPMSQAKHVRDMIEELCLRNLGLRDLGKIARQKWEIGKDLNFEPLRYVDIIRTEKENLRLLAYQGHRYIIGANVIHPLTDEEIYLRRNGQDLAIGCYEMLIQEFQHIIDVCDVDINLYKPYVEAIETEIRLLKSWRKSDFKRRSAA